MADTASGLSDKAGTAAGSAWESTKAADGAVADGATSVADGTAKVAGSAVEAAKVAASDAEDAVKGCGLRVRLPKGRALTARSLRWHP